MIIKYPVRERRAKRARFIPKRYCPTDSCLTLLRKHQRYCGPCSRARLKATQMRYMQSLREHEQELLHEESVSKRRPKRRDASLLPSVLSEKMVHDDRSSGDWDLVCRECRTESVKSVLSTLCDKCDPDPDIVDGFDLVGGVL